MELCSLFVFPLISFSGFVVVGLDFGFVFAVLLVSDFYVVCFLLV